MKRLFIVLIKYIPIIQMVGMLFNNIKVKKEEIIKEANKNIEVFKRFQEAARLNPNLTYAEFVKSLN